jgi:hypothetical protein
LSPKKVITGSDILIPDTHLSTTKKVAGPGLEKKKILLLATKEFGGWNNRAFCQLPTGLCIKSPLDLTVKNEIEPGPTGNVPILTTAAPPPGIFRDAVVQKS